MARATITIEGYVAKDPETRQVTGHRITSVTVPVTPQKKDGNGGYVDSGETVWYTAEFWDEHGLSVAEVVRKGQLVTVTGNLDITQREKDGRTYVNQTVSFGNIAVLVPRKRSSSQQPSQAPSAPVDDPWAHQSTPTGYNGSETPF
ncbi:single-stranded DNA-binding protein [Subtercola sp. PAMC28395]|uniref:single-stranded DNA-binding protein n=1 Tax=Subtercola sp. PAMC28395 TaxID=2846775 RepID=UPI001C0AC122|nr:single-stranded DNA-binding protein [Subtercola sp. PAMC28395]QWT24958.1 single-stranded DNA-binding protein [Subtercola sp. PAMC28395]